VLSVVCCASIKKLAASLKHKAIVRSMPNTPAQIGEGITVWAASHETSGAQRDLAGQILGALGEAVFVEDESYLDMATALSQRAGVCLPVHRGADRCRRAHGLPRRISEALVLQTLKGSAAYYQRAAQHPATLRNQVTSPGGTSAEALYYLEKAGFRSAISRAVWAAYQRSLELGKEKPCTSPSPSRMSPRLTDGPFSLPILDPVIDNPGLHREFIACHTAFDRPWKRMLWIAVLAAFAYLRALQLTYYRDDWYYAWRAGHLQGVPFHVCG
jgi:hypothetical protein